MTIGSVMHGFERFLNTLMGRDEFDRLNDHELELEETRKQRDEYITKCTCSPGINDSLIQPLIDRLPSCYSESVNSLDNHLTIWNELTFFSRLTQSMELDTLSGHLEPQTHTEWHPKLTPYRFLVLSTTIGLGSAKAYAVSRNIFWIATFVEWITGVVVFSVLSSTHTFCALLPITFNFSSFYILGLFELDPPRFLEWLLVPDLVPIFFRKVFQRPPPQYRSDELEYPTSPPVTGYRLLTCVCVALFGTAKAYFTYRHMPLAANTLEWSFGIIVTSL